MLPRAAVALAMTAVLAGVLAVSPTASAQAATCGSPTAGTMLIPLTGNGPKLSAAQLYTAAAKVMGSDLTMRVRELNYNVYPGNDAPDVTATYLSRSRVGPALSITANVVGFASCNLVGSSKWPQWSAALVAFPSGLAVRIFTVAIMQVAVVTAPFSLPAGEVLGGFTAGYLFSGLQTAKWGGKSIGAGMFGALLATVGGTSMRVCFGPTRDGISAGIRALARIDAGGNPWVNFVRPAFRAAEVELAELESGYNTAFEEFVGIGRVSR